MNKKTFFLLLIVAAIGLFLHFYRLNQSPPCLNADEIAFAYNSYSIFKTGKDEFGNFLPLRLTSFGDYKLPLLSYLNIPFIALFGLNQSSIKLINAFILFLYPFVLYLFVDRLFKNKKIALLSSFLFVCSWGVQSFSRQLHEALLTSLLIVISAYFLLLSVEKKKFFYEILFALFLLLSLFSYHSSRIFAAFFLLYQIILFFGKKIKLRPIILTVVVIFIFAVTDLIYKPKRVTNLLLFNHPGFSQKINELRKTDKSKLIYNKVTVAVKEITNRYLEYFASQFLAINGDKNLRFGNPYLSPITPIEYLFVFIGIYYLFKNKERWRGFVLGMLLITPLSGALTWTDVSLSRTFFILIISIILAGYGLVELSKNYIGINKFVYLSGISAIYLFFITFNWYYYLFTYPKNPLNQQAWQCGYRQLVEYVKKNYSKVDRFYITNQSGPPYIFLLYFLNYPPEKFQPQAKLGKVDIYGFQQVEAFDKFVFSLDYPKDKKNIIIIGRPWEIEETENKIYFGNNEVFWIKEIQ
jgi:hypothetical protein